jgi:hypothetical protein
MDLGRLGGQRTRLARNDTYKMFKVPLAAFS